MNTGGALLGTYGGRSPCVRTLRPDQESMVLEAAKEHNENNDKNENNKECKDNKHDKDDKETSFDPIPGEILYLPSYHSPYCLPYLSSCHLLLICLSILLRIFYHGLA